MFWWDRLAKKGATNSRSSLLETQRGENLFEVHSILNPYPYVCTLHCNVIIGRNPIEANANTDEIQLLGNPVAYTGNCYTLY